VFGNRIVDICTLAEVAQDALLELAALLGIGAEAVEEGGLRRVKQEPRPVQSLLAYLVLNTGIAQRREKLAGLLWPDSTESNARSNLRHALWRLRKGLGTDPPTRPDFVIADDFTITFNSLNNDEEKVIQKYHLDQRRKGIPVH